MRLAADGEAEEPEREAVGQLLQQARSARGEGFAHEVALGRPVGVGELHAPGVVHQDAHEVLLRHHGGEDQRRLEQAEEEHAQERHPEARHDRAVPRAAPCPGPACTSPRPAPPAPPPPRARPAPTPGAPKAKSPCSKTRGRYLKRNSKTRISGTCCVARGGSVVRSVAHAVDDHVRAHLVREGRVLRGYMGSSAHSQASPRSVFQLMTTMSSPVVVEDPPDVGHVSVLLAGVVR